VRSGDQVRISARLVEAPADRQLWAESFEGEYPRHTGASEQRCADHRWANPGHARWTGTGGTGQIEGGEPGGLRGLPQRTVFFEQTNRRRSEQSHRLLSRAVEVGNNSRANHRSGRRRCHGFRIKVNGEEPPPVCETAESTETIISISWSISARSRETVESVVMSLLQGSRFSVR
jgi:hypothetical protein